MESRELISLNDRKKTILFSAVDGYIRDASPVTSQLIHNTVMNDVSTATLRNELNSLEAMGYLTQLHTSSGRVPTTKGYRFFVDELLKNNSFTPKNLDIARKNIFTRTGNISEIVSSIADMVSKTTNYPAVVVLDGFENLSIISIRVMLLITGQMLVLIDTNTGVINNTVSVGVSITKDDCDNASNIFTEVFAGKTLGYLMHNIDSFSDTVRNAMESYKDIFDVVVSMLRVYQHKGTASGGMLKLLDNPEYSDIDKARGVLAVLDDKTKLADIFDTANDDGVSVKIGSENDVEELDNCAVIKTPIVIDGNKVGSVGVIGPKRIDYATVAGILKVITDEINNGGYDER